MDLTGALKLIEMHNNGEIHIKTLLHNQNVVMDNIEKGSKIYYNKNKNVISYINSQGIVNTFTNVRIIDQVIYEKLDNNSSNNNNNNCNCGKDDCNCDDSCPCNKDKFPNSKIINEGYKSRDGVIYPTELEDGSLVYDCGLGTLFDKNQCCCNNSKNSGYIITDKENFSDYFGVGYALLTYGKLIMDINVPKDSYYSFKVRSGSETNSGKRGSIFINNIERYVRTPADMEDTWNISDIEKFEDNSFLSLEAIKLKQGVNHIVIAIDTNKGTINNCYDCIILRNIDEQPSPDDPEEYFRITKKQYDDIITTLNKTFITVNSLDELFNYNKENIVDGRLFKVNNVNGKSVYYSYDLSTGSFKNVESSLSESNDANNILTSDNITVSFNIGGYKQGDVITKGTSVQDILKNLVSKDKSCEVTNPSFNIEIINNDENDNCFEVGTITNLEFKLSFNNGSYSQTLNNDQVDTGVVFDYVVINGENKVIDNNPMNITLENVTITDDFEITFNAHHTAGNVPKTYLGNDDVYNRIEESTISNSILIDSYRKTFIGYLNETVDSVDNDIIRNLQNSINIEKDNPYEFTVPKGSKEIIIAIPSSTVNNKTINFEYLTLVWYSFTGFEKNGEPIMVKGNNEYDAESYDVYTFKASESFEVDTKYRITLL